MSTRLCHQCFSEIPDERTYLFCDKQCFIEYRHDSEHSKIPDKPLYKDEFTA